MSNNQRVFKKNDVYFFAEIDRFTCTQILFLSIFSIPQKIALLSVCSHCDRVCLVSPTRQLQTPTNIILLSLAVSDLLVGATVVPITVIVFQNCKILRRIVCILQLLLSFILTSASVGNMVLISVDRYLAICYPLRYPLILTIDRIKISVSLCWFISIIYNIIMLKDQLAPADFSNPCYQKCKLVKNNVADGIDMFLTFVGPLSVIILLYMRVFVVALSQVRALRSHISATATNTVTIKRSTLKAARTLGIVLLVFIFCFCPYYIPSSTGQDSMPSPVYIFQLWLLYANSTFNPLIYAIFYPWFRKAIKIIVTLQVVQSHSSEWLLM